MTVRISPRLAALLLTTMGLLWLLPLAWLVIATREGKEACQSSR